MQRLTSKKNLSLYPLKDRSDWKAIAAKSNTATSEKVTLKGSVTSKGSSLSNRLATSKRPDPFAPFKLALVKLTGTLIGTDLH